MSITLFDAFSVATTFEKVALIVVLVVAVLGLLYAAFLTRQVLREPTGTDKMKKISTAIRTGGNAYLKRQFRTIILILVTCQDKYGFDSCSRSEEPVLRK